ILASARPTVIERIPTYSVDMMLVLDISLSMMAEDIHPSRIEAAKAAAEDFIRSLPDQINIGLEFFAGSPYVVSPPTEDHEKILGLLDSLKKEDLQVRTEIGSALEAALKILQPQSRSNPSHKNAMPHRVIVLMSDGDSREGYPWDVAAVHAREQNV